MRFLWSWSLLMRGRRCCEFFGGSLLGFGLGRILADCGGFFRYKIGDAFVHLPLSEAQELLATSTEQIDKDVVVLEEKVSNVREEMQGLKVALYARFGKSINLET